MKDYKINCVGMSGEQKRLVQDAFFKLGYKWTTGGAIFLEDKGDQHYYLAYPSGKLTYCEEIDIFRGKNHTKITLNELLKLANMEEYMTFTKADLRDGMVVKVRGGSYNADKYGKLSLVVGNSLQQATEYELLSIYLDDLTCTSLPTYDIMEVFEVVNSALPINRIQDWQLKRLWKRPEPISAQQQAIIELEAKQQELIDQAEKIKADILKLKGM